MIDVGGNDGPTRGHFGANKLRSNLDRNALRKASEDAGCGLEIRLRNGQLGAAGMLLLQVVPDVVLGEISNPGAAEILANGDELHLGCDDALAGVPQLRHGMALTRLQRAAALSLQSGELHQPIPFRLAGVFRVLAGQVAVVLRFNLAPLVLRDIAAPQDPLPAQRRQSFLHGALETGIAPRTRAVVHPHGFVEFDSAVKRLGGRELDFAHRHLQVRVQSARQIHPGRIGERLGAVGFERGLGISDHGRNGEAGGGK